MVIDKKPSNLAKNREKKSALRKLKAKPFYYSSNS